MIQRTHSRNAFSVRHREAVEPQPLASCARVVFRQPGRAPAGLDGAGEDAALEAVVAPLRTPLLGPAHRDRQPASRGHVRPRRGLRPPTRSSHLLLGAEEHAEEGPGEDQGGRGRHLLHRGHHLLCLLLASHQVGEPRVHEGGTDLLHVPACPQDPVPVEIGNLVRPLLPELATSPSVATAPEPGAKLRTQIFRGPFVGQCQGNGARVSDPHFILRLPQLRGHHP